MTERAAPVRSGAPEPNGFAGRIETPRGAPACVPRIPAGPRKSPLNPAGPRRSPPSPSSPADPRKFPRRTRARAGDITRSRRRPAGALSIRARAGGIVQACAPRRARTPAEPP